MELTRPEDDTKKGWRRRTRGLRKELTAAQTPQERVTQAEQIANHAVALLQQVRGSDDLAGACVTAYESWAVEPPTEALVATLQARGVTVLVPVTLPDLDLDWRDAATPDDGAHLLGLDAIGRADLVLAPAQAVDTRTGTRLGQGGGCYDRALPRRRPGTPVVAVLNAHESAALDLPREPTDIPVDATLTADGITWVGPEG